ncbi:hypothetical protein D3C86_1543300 [compost metagenome]
MFCRPEGGHVEKTPHAQRSPGRLERCCDNRVASVADPEVERRTIPGLEVFAPKLEPRRLDNLSHGGAGRIGWNAEYGSRCSVGARCTVVVPVQQRRRQGVDHQAEGLDAQRAPDRLGFKGLVGSMGHGAGSAGVPSGVMAEQGLRPAITRPVSSLKA